MTENEINLNTPLATMTLGQLATFLEARPHTIGAAIANTPAPTPPSRRYVYGIKGIMDLFNVSKVTAGRYKKGVIREAVSQSGRIIVVDADKALQLFNARKGNE